MRKLFFLLFFSLLKIVQFQEDSNIINLIHMGKKYGFDLTNPEELFFHDICRYFRYIKKDITLNYRRKYLFFPKNKDNILSIKLINQIPLRNNSNKCFNSNNSFLSLFTNIAFISFLPLFIIQFLILLMTIFLKLDGSVKNTPFRKIEKKRLNIQNNKNIGSAYSEFIPEVDINQKYKGKDLILKNEKTQNDDMNLTEQNLKNDFNEENGRNIIRNSAAFYNDQNNNSINNNGNTSNNENNNSNNDNINDNNNSSNDINNDEEENKKKDEKNDVPVAIEKSTDNYTFGLQFGKEIKFSSNYSINKKTNNNKKEENKENKEDKYKRIQYVYEQMNQKKINPKKNIQNANIVTPIVSTQTQKYEVFYIREEYFYFGYALAILEDKRTIYQIYIDLLEQCQIFFKLFLNPFNIYEDRSLQIFYYLTKINLYFLFNCLLISSQVINDIYDNKHYFISDFKRSILATIYTYIISLFIYYLTNVKKQLIRRRYKIINLKISDSRLNNEITRFTMNFCINFLYNKILLLILVFFILFLYSGYICFSFCNVYYYTQFLLLKCVLISITISQIFPIIVCWLPAILRNKILKKKKRKLYDILKYLEFLFIA